MIIGIIQARMASTRLPGKAMLPLANKPMLENYMERCMRSEMIDDFVLATTEKDEDTVLLDVARSVGARSYRGAEDDLVGRIYQCAKYHGANIIVRLCADNPVVEPKEIDRIITLYLAVAKTGYLFSNDHNILGNNYPDGLGAEVYTLKSLMWLNDHIDDPLLREHPHMWFYTNDKVMTVPCPEEFAYPSLKLDVNTEEEYLYIKKIYDRFGHNRFHITEYLPYVLGVKK